MKSILILTVATILMSCGIKKNETSKESQHDTTLLKSEMYFKDCDKALEFFKLVIVNNNSDKNLKEGHFRIPFIKSSYEDAKSLFPEKCFIGISNNELEKIFGRGILEGNFATWYILENLNNQMAIEVRVRDGVVEKFKVGASTVESSNP